MGRMSWAAITRKDGPVCPSANSIAGERLWERRCVEKPQGGLSHCAWKSSRHDQNRTVGKVCYFDTPNGQKR